MSEDQERSEGRRQGWAEAVAALRDSSRFWEFMETHPMGEDGAEFMVSGNEACADYLASLAASVDSEPRVFALPPEPGPEVTRLHNRLDDVEIERDDDGDWLAYRGGVCVFMGRWADLLVRFSPLADATPTGEQPSTERSDG